MAENNSNQQPTSKKDKVGSTRLTPSQAMPKNNNNANNADTNNGLKPVTNSNTSSKSKNDTTGSQNNNNNNRNNRNNGRRRGGNNKNRKPQNNNQNQSANTTDGAAASTSGVAAAAAESSTTPQPTTSKNKPKRNRQRGRQRGNKDNIGNGEAVDNKDNENISASRNDQTNDIMESSKSPARKGSGKPNQGGKNTNNTNKTKNNKKKPRKKYPWRRFIPKGTVDPITLENLISLEYPPFALCADEPYVPVVWPVSEEENEEDANKKANQKPVKKSIPSEADLEELHRQRLAEQWGTVLLPLKKNEHGDLEENKGKSDAQKPAANPQSSLEPSKTIPPPSKRPYNLFDGRALAYYMVSQLQFIDPLNRRDLTRPELVNLDEYLVRHGLFTGDLKVTEAYDAKGVTLSSAGAAAATAQGQADIMQQMAQQLLNSLFTGHSVSSRRRLHDYSARENDRQQAQSFSLQEQYAALQRQEREIAQQRHAAATTSIPDDTTGVPGIQGTHGGGTGFMIIDDDENPEMRGRNDFPSLADVTNGGNSSQRYSDAGPLYSASHIADQNRGDGMMASRTSTSAAFPALPTPAVPNTAVSAATTDTVNTDNSSKKPPPKASKTLSKISKLVKKTDPEEKQRQWEAREAARKRAMMANLSFGTNPSVADPFVKLSTPLQSSVSGATEISEEQLQRNRVLAEALGVKPATQRHYSSGWARPTDGQVAIDEFGNELNAALYPHALIAAARERMPQVLKLEKKWKAFLGDDKAASLPLNPMDRPTRAVVHQYAEFWNLKTESFDPEPKRYIHCVKLLDTRMPYPLLSEAARNWSGPVHEASDHTVQQTAGQSSMSRELPPPPDRVPLQLLPRASSPSAAYRPPPTVTEKGANLAEAASSRFDGLLERERPRLELAPRTVPLELPPFEPQQEEDGYDAAEDLKNRQARLEDRRRRELEAERKKKQVLEEAFASDDEDSNAKVAATGGDSDSEWGDEPEALYTGDDDEE
mmetsp:Transcript_24591/g.43641  ORF Transcript_24591/g.43641 Transcript_24591/m.43641 type:complete len:991 (-) Transcript_24591:2926-5898(-)|eukprot:CAMPEP_0178787410 /NCGR_PEP_ID=MMETSP0745-20121128/5837_1 /TAXON_ID=913974 /ORGANISM="Nitzschia punctata, Strain CCMP561" /LENGTH=990 /DNA_ID=CAMNT_0020445253 /DNA_START=85 /DNA_END=3057 /DNA_ORIENTATION=+